MGYLYHINQYLVKVKVKNERYEQFQKRYVNDYLHKKDQRIGNKTHVEMMKVTTYKVLFITIFKNVKVIKSSLAL